jgi:hypothetical protein
VRWNGQERRALHEKERERRKPEVRHRNVAAASLPGIRKTRTDRAQPSQQGRQKFHPNARIMSLLIWESRKCTSQLLLELLAGDNLDGDLVSRRFDDYRVDCRAQERF